MEFEDQLNAAQEQRYNSAILMNIGNDMIERTTVVLSKYKVVPIDGNTRHRLSYMGNGDPVHEACIPHRIPRACVQRITCVIDYRCTHLACALIN